MQFWKLPDKIPNFIVHVLTLHRAENQGTENCCF